MNLPDPRPLPDLPNANDSFRIDSQFQASVPCVFVADEAFPLSTICMKPYTHKNLLESYILFNYRFSRVRKTTKNAFGILSNRFITFCSKICLKPETVTKMLMASCFHTLLKTKLLRTVLSLKDSEGMNILRLIFKLVTQLDQGTLQFQRMSGIYFENILLGETRYHGNGNISI